MPPDGPARGPVAYLLACYLISALLTILFAVLLLFPVVGLAVLFAPPSDPTDLMTTVGGVLAVALIGVLALGALYLVSALLFFLWIPFQHAFVLLFARRSQRGVVATARLSCYAAGATMLFSWLPVVGILAIPYSIYLLTTGLKRVHRASNLRALAATLAPTAISFVLLVAGGRPPGPRPL
jgi:Yip1 domain